MSAKLTTEVQNFLEIEGQTFPVVDGHGIDLETPRFLISNEVKTATLWYAVYDEGADRPSLDDPYVTVVETGGSRFHSSRNTSSGHYDIDEAWEIAETLCWVRKQYGSIRGVSRGEDDIIVLARMEEGEDSYDVSFELSTMTADGTCSIESLDALEAMAQAAFDEPWASQFEIFKQYLKVAYQGDIVAAEWFYQTQGTYLEGYGILDMRDEPYYQAVMTPELAEESLKAALKEHVAWIGGETYMIVSEEYSLTVDGWDSTENREYSCFYYGIEQAEQDIIGMYEYASTYGSAS